MKLKNKKTLFFNIMNLTTFSRLKFSLSLFNQNRNHEFNPIISETEKDFEKNINNLTINSKDKR